MDDLVRTKDAVNKLALCLLDSDIPTKQLLFEILSAITMLHEYVH